MMGGVCDMTLFHFYFRDHPRDTLKIDLIDNELAVDVSMNNSDGYEMENGLKKFTGKTACRTANGLTMANYQVCKPALPGRCQKTDGKTF
jgi:hypothetical protein